jgi:hypothetical protein
LSERLLYYLLESFRELPSALTDAARIPEVVQGDADMMRTAAS